MEMFDYLERFIIDADHKAIYVLALICVAMVIDFLSGTLAAKINPKIEFESKLGINGILRKVASIVLLLFFIPLAPLIPAGVGVGLVYVLYVGYLLMELKSILENYKKMGVATELFEDFINKIKSKDDE
ncbi:phage holin family protein [Enterococcus sp. BWR-S5]|uniref:phage holin family protein n=1 Tax=Enterococcus sp. BWR-S5 TaxID=2787714 RepID=UPI001921E2B5|nr:phage holin family protein [Enterococcus sp. BWR-S5]MBL1224781.1 phage holin family protein [Enterococcus sp. BWR-S5]